MDEKCSGDWVDVLMASVDKYIAMETTDGCQREGKISGFRYREFKFNGKIVLVPDEIELNYDKNDRIPLIRIAFMDIT